MDFRNFSNTSTMELHDRQVNADDMSAVIRYGFDVAFKAEVVEDIVHGVEEEVVNVNNIYINNEHTVNATESQPIKQKKSKNVKEMGETCKSVNCLQSKLRNCDKFTEQERKLMFLHFCKLSFDAKQEYVKSRVQLVEIKRSSVVGTTSKKQFSFIFKLTLNGYDNVQVCRNMFLQTLGLKADMVRRWIIPKPNQQTEQNYNSSQNTTTTGTTNDFNKQNKTREMGETCKSAFCLKSKFKHCSIFSEQDRQSIFTLFWKLNSDARREYVTNRVKKVIKKKRKVKIDQSSSGKKTKNNFTFKLTMNERDNVRVCRDMFLQTLGLKLSIVRKWITTTNPNRQTEQNYTNYNTAAAVAAGTASTKRYSKKQNMIINESEMGETCKSNYCLKSTVRHCDKFTEQERQFMFNYFWKLSCDAKQEYVTSRVRQIEIKRSSVVGTTSKKQYSYIYQLTLNGNDNVQVCRNMFLQTLGLKHDMLRKWIAQNRI